MTVRSFETFVRLTAATPDPPYEPVTYEAPKQFIAHHERALRPGARLDVHHPAPSHPYLREPYAVAVALDLRDATAYDGLAVSSPFVLAQYIEGDERRWHFFNRAHLDRAALLWRVGGPIDLTRDTQEQRPPQTRTQ